VAGDRTSPAQTRRARQSGGLQNTLGAWDKRPAIQCRHLLRRDPGKGLVPRARPEPGPSRRRCRSSTGPDTAGGQTFLLSGLANKPLVAGVVGRTKHWGAHDLESGAECKTGQPCSVRSGAVHVSTSCSTAANVGRTRWSRGNDLDGRVRKWRNSGDEKVHEGRDTLGQRRLEGRGATRWPTKIAPTFNAAVPSARKTAAEQQPQRWPCTA